MMKKGASLLLSLIAFSCLLSVSLAQINFDLIVYGATPSGLAAAISAAWQNNKLNIGIIEPTAYIGGMCIAGGIGLRDLGNETTFINTIGYQWAMLNSKHYGVTYPVYQADMPIQEASMYAMIDSFPNIKIVYNTSLVLASSSVVKKGTDITTIVTQTVGQTTTSEYSASVYIDASYEGDLARYAGASYTYGRESLQAYNESYAGVRAFTPTSNFLYSTPVSAVTSPTDNTIINYVDTEPLNPVGSEDDRMMGYSFRLCITPTKSKQVPFFAPPNYNPDDFVLLQRYIDSLVSSGTHPKGPELGQVVDVLNYRNYPDKDKFDMCDGPSAFTSDAINLNKGYVTGTYEERELIYNNTYYYVLGLVYYLSSNPNVPEFTRNNTNSYGLCKDQWLDNKNIPTQLYVREGLRIIGDYVFTQNDIVGAKYYNDSIAVGSWLYDIHVVSRVASQSANGPIVMNEGNIVAAIAGSGSAYEIPAGILFPKKEEVTNLIVPVCHSATHVAYASTRVEPTFIQLGESSGIVGALAVEKNTTVQDVNIADVQSFLTQRGIQVHVTSQ